VCARVELPGSKSQTNRVLLVCALADGVSRIARPLRARDTELMAEALRNLGARIQDDGEDWVVTPGALHGGAIDTGLAGTVMRFVPPVAALADDAVTFDGDEYSRERPMATLLDGLRQAGAVVVEERPQSHDVGHQHEAARGRGGGEGELGGGAGRECNPAHA